jgi:hypothetical protein
MKNSAFGEQRETISQILKEEERLLYISIRAELYNAEEREEFTFVKGITLTNGIKNDAVTFTKKLMEERNFMLPDDGS